MDKGDVMQKTQKLIEKSPLSFLVGINLATALGIQILMQLMVYFMVHSTPLRVFDGQSGHEIMTTILYFACIGTAFSILIPTFLAQNSQVFDVTKVYVQEILRAVYFSVSAMIGICVVMTVSEKNTLQTILLLFVASLILFLGGYHRKFEEARRGIWFPHSLFQIIAQYFLFLAILQVMQKIP